MQAMNTKIRIPRKFYDDHRDRELPTPCPYRVTKTVVVIQAYEPAVAELLSDARSYADPADFDPDYRALCRSAARTVAAIEAARPDLA